MSTPNTVASGIPAWIEVEAGLGGPEEYDADLLLVAEHHGPATVAVLRLAYRHAEAGTELTLDDLYALQAACAAIIATEAAAPGRRAAYAAEAWERAGLDPADRLATADDYEAALGDPRSYE